MIVTQSLFSQSSLYKLKTGRMGEATTDPRPNIPKTKIINQITRDNSRYTIYMKEYVEGKLLDDAYAMIEMYNGDKGVPNIRWEIDSDTTSTHHIRIFGIFLGALSIRDRFCNADKYFNYVYFK